MSAEQGLTSLLTAYRQNKKLRSTHLAKKEQQDRSIGLAPRSWILILEALALVDSYFAIQIDLAKPTMASCI
jgi:hypothetical protein